MPANLTPMYLKAERDYRRAQTAMEQLECLQLMLQLLPKHKGTDKLQAEIRSRISDARQLAQKQLNAPRSGNEPKFPRQGAGRIVIVGAPNSGKSRLLDELTDAKPEVARFPFSTIHPMPGMMPVDGLQVQLIDTPAVTAGALPVWLLNMVRSADAVALMMDGSSDDAPEETAAVIREFVQRKTVFSDRTGFDPNDFSIVNVQTLLIATKTTPQCVDWPIRQQFLQEQTPINFGVMNVDFNDDDVSTVRKRLFQLLNVQRVFTKKPGEEVDFTSPLPVAAGATVLDLATQIHEDLAAGFQYARLWRDQQHDGQTVGADYPLRDQDIVELH